MADPSVTETFTRLVDLMARLRAPGGCPWDREQTPASLRPYLLEEVYEVLEAIDADDPAHLRDELGDLLLQIVFQSELAAEAGRFTVADVARAIVDKLVRRHPHVFGDVRVRDAGEVVRNWRRIKAEERRTAGEDGDLFAGVPAASPALVRAEQLGEKAGHVGLDWPDALGVLEKLREETVELEAALAAGDRAASEHELGDLLLAAASLGRHLEVSAEMALRAANDRFVARVRRLEAAARERGQALADLAPAERDPGRRCGEAGAPSPLRFGAAEWGASIGRRARRLIGAPTAPPPPRCAIRPRARAARLRRHAERKQAMGFRRFMFRGMTKCATNGTSPA